MYNDIIMIIMCVFAVYGAYAFFREIVMIFLRKIDVVAAVRVKNNPDEFLTGLTAADLYISTYPFLERRPVLLCESDEFEDFKKYGYDIYIKQTEEK